MKKHLFVIVASLLLTVGIANADTIGSLSPWQINNNIIHPIVSSSSVQIPSLGAGAGNCVGILNASGTLNYVTCGSGGGSSTVLYSGYGITLTPNPINTTGTVAVNTSTLTSYIATLGYLTSASGTASFYPLSNPSNFTTTTIQSVLNSLSATGLATYNSSTGVFNVSSSILTPYLTTASATALYYPLTNPSGYLSSSTGLTYFFPATTTIFLSTTTGNWIGTWQNKNSSDFLSSSTTYVATNTGNWAGTWQGVNSTTFYLATNPSNFSTTTIQSVLNSLSATSPVTYNSSTGVFAWTNSNGYITLASLSGLSPLSYNNGTGQFSCPTCVTVVPTSTITINGITTSTFNFLAGGTGLTVASSGNQITYTWTNPGYISANQTITLTGAVTGSGATTIATTFTTSTLYGLFSASNPITFNTTTGAIACATCLTTSTFNATGTAFNFPYWNGGLSATSSLKQNNGGIGVNVTNDGSANLETYASGTLQGLRIVDNGGVTDIPFSTYLNGDNFLRFSFLADGTMKWGNGAVAGDTNLYRFATSTLKTDGSLLVGSTINASGTISSNGIPLITNNATGSVGQVGIFNATNTLNSYSSLYLDSTNSNLQVDGSGAATGGLSVGTTTENGFLLIGTSTPFLSVAATSTNIYGTTNLGNINPADTFTNLNASGTQYFEYNDFLNTAATSSAGTASTSINIATTTGLAASGLVAIAGTEIASYGSFTAAGSSSTLNSMVRGLFGTTKQAIANGTAIQAVTDIIANSSSTTPEVVRVCTVNNACTTAFNAIPFATSAAALQASGINAPGSGNFTLCNQNALCTIGKSNSIVLQTNTNSVVLFTGGIATDTQIEAYTGLKTVINNSAGVPGLAVSSSSLVTIGSSTQPSNASLYVFGTSTFPALIASGTVQIPSIVSSVLKTDGSGNIGGVANTMPTIATTTKAIDDVAPVAGDYLPIWYSDTAYTIKAVDCGNFAPVSATSTADTFAFQLVANTSLAASSTQFVFTNWQTCTATTTPQVITSFSNASISAGNWLSLVVTSTAANVSSTGAYVDIKF